MPTNRKRVRRAGTSEPWVVSYYLHGYEGQGRRALMWGNDDALLAYPWDVARKELLPAWIASNPCSRPWMWWETDSPGPRRRVGGSGRRERRARFEFGRPFHPWFRDVDVAAPPLYESQAAYLQRHGLLTAAEKKWLAANPGSLAPQAIEIRIETGPEIRPLDGSRSYYEDRTDI